MRSLPPSEKWDADWKKQKNGFSRPNSAIGLRGMLEVQRANTGYQSRAGPTAEAIGQFAWNRAPGSYLDRPVGIKLHASRIRYAPTTCSLARHAHPGAP